MRADFEMIGIMMTSLVEGVAGASSGFLARRFIWEAVHIRERAAFITSFCVRIRYNMFNPSIY